MKKLFKDLTVGLAITAVLFGIAEIGVRIFWKTKWHEHPNTTYRDESGWKHAPGRYDPKTSPVGFAGDVNQLGYRGREWTIEKPKGSVRIMCVGDSVVLGYGSYKMDGGFPNDLEKLANEAEKKSKSPRAIEVLNAGIPANTSEQAAFRFEHELTMFKPDVAVIAVGPNDMPTENPRMIPTKIPGNPMRKLTEKSYLLRAVFGVFFKVVIPRLKPDYRNQEEHKKELENFTPVYYVQSLTKIVRAAQANGIQPVLATLPVQFNCPDYAEADYRPAAFTYGKNVELYRMLVARYNEAVRQVAQSEGVPLADMAEYFHATPGTNKYFLDYFHLTDPGNEAYAAQLLKVLQAHKLL